MWKIGFRRKLKALTRRDVHPSFSTTPLSASKNYSANHPVRQRLSEKYHSRLEANLQPSVYALLQSLAGSQASLEAGMESLLLGMNHEQSSRQKNYLPDIQHTSVSCRESCTYRVCQRLLLSSDIKRRTVRDGNFYLQERGWGLPFGQKGHRVHDSVASRR
jgi:hypothetical protein